MSNFLSFFSNPAKTISLSVVFFKRFVLASLLCLSVLSFSFHSSQAQSAMNGGAIEEDDIMPPDFDVALSRGLARFDAGVAGDSIDTSNGSLSFRHTDVSLPGNSGLPVSFGRFYTYRGVDYHGNQLGGWNMDVPFMQSIRRLGLEHEYSTLLQNSPIPIDQLFSGTRGGCTVGAQVITQTEASQSGGSIINRFGSRLFVPGQGGTLRSSATKLSSAERSNLFGEIIPSSVTHKNWVFRCNGETLDSNGQGQFEGIAPNGWIYKFGHGMTHLAKRVFVSEEEHQRTSDAAPSNECFGGQGAEGLGCPTLGFQGEARPTYLLANSISFPTEIRDPNGNWVRYEYSGRRLLRIHANDGREITFEYAGDINAVQPPRISKVIANGREWIYNYSVNDATGVSMLMSVTQPDDLKWVYDLPRQPPFQSSTDPCIGGPSTAQTPVTATLSVTHPAGTHVTFDIKRIEQGYTKVPDIKGSTPQVSDPTTNCRAYYEPKSSASYAVSRKTLNLPGGSDFDSKVEVWTYDYQQDEGEFIDEDDFVAPSGPTGTNDLRRTTVTDPEGNRVEHYYDRRFDSPTKGQMMMQKSYSSGSSTPLETIENSYNITMPEYGYSGLPGSCLSGPEDNCNRYNEYTTRYNTPYQRPILADRPIAQTIITRDGDTYTSTNSYNTNAASSTYSYGYPTSTSSYSNVSSSPRTTITEYEHNKSKWILGLPKKITQNGREMKRYDYNALGQTESVARYGQADFMTFDYNSDGTIKSYIDAIGRQTDAHDWKRGKPQRIVRAVGTTDEVTTEQFVDDNGWLTSQTDARGNETSYSHDIMGRLTQINPTGAWAKTEIDYDFPSAGGAVLTTTKGPSESTVTYDSMFRPVLEKTEALDTGWTSYVNMEYDGLGRTIFTSQPSSSATESKGTNTTYDGLGRVYDVTENVAPFAKMRHRYLNNHRHRIYDPSGAITQYYSYGYDGPGNTDYRAIFQHDGSKWVRYTYLFKNVHGQMTRLRQWGSQNGISVNKSQYFYYDNRQRLCRHYVPEHGASLYQYDDAGQMTAYAKGQGNSGCGTVPNVNDKVSMTHDNLGRLKMTDFTHSATPDIMRDYDANGNLLSVNRGTGLDTVDWDYTYDDINNLTAETLHVDGRTYHMAYNYNNNGYMTSNQYPSGIKMTYALDGLGRTLLARNQTAGKTYASGLTYHPSGTLTGMSYGNGQVYTKTLNDRLLPERLTAKKGTLTGIDQLYNYDARGLVTSMTDYANRDNDRSYSYDGLRQLVSASNNMWGPATFKYDSLGNVREKVLDGRKITLNYDSRNRVNQSIDTGDTGTRPVAYDNRGNVTTLGTMGFVYDKSDQPTVVSGTANGVGTANGNYYYDGNLKRVKSVVNGKTIYNVYNAAGALVHVDEDTDNKQTDYVKAGGMAVARVTGTEVLYEHADLLGSPRSLTDVSGSPDEKAFYSPFGMEYGNTNIKSDQAGFTGHIKDSATGLNYMQARYYDPVMGRFLSVDPVTFMDNGNPGYFNRYAYTMNDPINMFDPDGRESALALLKMQKEHPVPEASPRAQAIAQGVSELLPGSGIANALVNDIPNGDIGSAIGNLASELPAAKLGKLGKVAKLAKGCCFVEGTLVETETGLRPIEEIKVGDLVLSRNPETGETAYKEVTAFIPRHDRIIWTVSLSGENDSSENFETTDEHPWWIINDSGDGSWKRTDELTAGMIVTTADNQSMTIVSAFETERLDGTYNITVADFETYFVGVNKVLVHNCDLLPAVKKGVNSNIGHAADRAVERGVFPDAASAKSGLKSLSASFKKNGFPEGTIRDPANLDRVLVPVGNGGRAAFQVGSNGTAKLKTVLNRLDE